MAIEQVSKSSASEGVRRITVSTHIAGKEPTQETVVLDERPRWARIDQSSIDEDRNNAQRADN